ncbi:hypothetical protein [Macrococcus psychrotolerans]|uniref:Uncharacterized protein n=1 Tax=Macrococcus psychrotolerans TaxID=3039389 RepID=A0AAU6RL86_9STAP
MKPLRRIIYCIKLIDNDGMQPPVYDISYHYLIQVVGAGTRVAVDESIYEYVTYSSETIRYLDIYAIDTIYPEAKEYRQYLYLAQKEIQSFYTKRIRTYRLESLC